MKAPSVAKLAGPSLLLAAVVWSGCNSGNPAPNANSGAAGNSNTSVFVTPPPPLKPSVQIDPSFKPCNPFYPLVPGSLTKHTIFYSSGLVADVTTVVEPGENAGEGEIVQREQILDTSGGLNKLSTNTRTYVCDGERVRILSEKGHDKVEENENLAESKFHDPAIVMVAPTDFRPGATWSYVIVRTLQQPGKAPITLEPITRRLEYRTNEEVTVLAGKYTAARVDWRLKEKTGTDYYVRGLGLVKRVADDGTRWELKEYSGLQPSE